MAAKQTVVKVVDWGQIMQRCTSQNKAKMLAFKNKTDGLLAANMKAKSLDTTINWQHYEKVIADNALVQDFKKKYESFKVPQPVDTKSTELTAKEKMDKETVAQFVEETNAKIKKLSVDLDRLLALPAVEQLTNDDIMEHFPQCRPDYKKYPYWPHRSMESLQKFYA